MQYTNSQLSAIIAERVHSERDRKIMRMKLIDGKTYEQIAEETELSPRQTRRIVERLKKSIK